MNTVRSSFTFRFSSLPPPSPTSFGFLNFFFLRFPQAQALSTELRLVGYDLKVTPTPPPPWWVLPYRRGCAAEQGVVFVLFVINRVYNSAQTVLSRVTKLRLLSETVYVF